MDKKNYTFPLTTTAKNQQAGKKKAASQQVKLRVCLSASMPKVGETVLVRRYESPRSDRPCKAVVTAVKAGALQVKYADNKLGWFTNNSQKILRAWPVLVETNPAAYPDDLADEQLVARLEACVYNDIDSNEDYQTFVLGTVYIPKKWHDVVGNDSPVQWSKVGVPGHKVLQNLMERRPAEPTAEANVVVRFTRDAFSSVKFREMQFEWRKQLAGYRKQVSRQARKNPV